MNHSLPPLSNETKWKTALFLSILSGAAALGHQLLWTRRLIDLLGAGAESTSRVFGVFFLGLALGSAAALALAGRARRPWRWLAAAEIAIALLALPVYLLPWWSEGIWPALGPDRLISVWGGMVKLGLSVALVLPPAFVMGWFLPFAARGLFGGGLTLARHGVSLYGWNTMGGVAGLVLVVLLFLPLLGAAGAAAAVIGLNIFTALGCLWLDRHGANPLANEPSPVASPTPAAFRVSVNPWFWGLAFFSGFGILALEVATLQMLMLVAPLSFHAPAGILICVILVLALAAFATRRLTALATPSRLLVPVLAGAALLAAATPLVFHTTAMVTGGLPPAPNLTLFGLRLVVFVLITCGPLFLVAGLLFPVLTAWIGGEDGGGKRWGGLLAVNGLGGLAGAETAHGFLLPWAGPFGAAWVVGGLYAGLGLALALSPTTFSPQAPRIRPARMALAATGAAALWLLLGTPVRTLSPVNPHVNLTVLETLSGREGVLSVVERGDFGRGLLVYNQYMLGTTSARHDQERQAHLPLLLHPNPEEVAFIGLATGITPGAALLHREAGRISAVELSAQVAAASRDWFAAYNHGLFDDPRARVVIEDGRTYLAASRERFDVVAGDLFLPWGPGEARLYSLEHFRAVRKSLRSGGLFCQWLALYQLRPEDLEVILRTFHKVFPETWLFVNTFRPDSPALALVGFREGRLDWATVERRTAAERENRLVADPVVRHRRGIGMLFLGRAPDPEPGPLHTLTNLRIELEASRGRITGDPSAKYLMGQRWLDWSASLLDRSPEEGGPSSPELAEAGRLLAQREILLRKGEDLTAAERRRLRDIFPSEINRDDEADWLAWPGVTPRF